LGDRNKEGNELLIEPRFRGFICTTAHPTGCAESVRRQIETVKARGPIPGPKRVLVLGASTGYGLASRITAAFGCGAATIGVSFERPSDGNRTATAGWYQTAAFEREACVAGLGAWSLNGDAFSDGIKRQALDLVRDQLGQVDLVVYSLASPRRQHPRTGELLNSVLKPIGRPYASKTVDFHTGVVTDVAIEPATDEEIRQTVAVMGGEDWSFWIDALLAEGLLAPGATTVAYSYIGPAVTHPVYREGTIGRAKDDLEATAQTLTQRLSPVGGRAFVSVNKALVTQASSAIPVVPLYVSLLYKIMKARGTHEGCIEQAVRLFSEHLYGGSLSLDEKGRIRVDDLELDPDVQAEVAAVWPDVDTGSIESLTDIAGYRTEFFRLFGFGFDGVDYAADVDPEVDIPSLATDPGAGD